MSSCCFSGFEWQPKRRWSGFGRPVGLLQGLNNKIKILKRPAYGFRDMEYFKLQLMFTQEANPSFSG